MRVLLRRLTILGCIFCSALAVSAQSRPPQTADEYDSAGFAAQQAKKFQEALEFYAALAGYYGHLGRNDDALRLLLQAIQVRQNDARLLLLLGRLQIEQGSLIAAVDDLRRAVALAPDSAAANLSLGNCLRTHGSNP